MQFKGVVSSVSPFEFNGNTLWSFQLNNDRSYYRCGKVKPKIEVGQYIIFEGTPGNKQGSVNADTKSIQVKSVEEESSGIDLYKAKASGAAKSKDDFWERKETRDIATQKRIEIQSCRNSAIEFVKILFSQEAVKVPAKQAEKVPFIEELLAHYQEQFLKENSGEKTELVEATADPTDAIDTEVPY